MMQLFFELMGRALTRAIIEGAYSYIGVLPGGFPLKTMTLGNLSGTTRVYEYAAPQLLF